MRSPPPDPSPIEGEGRCWVPKRAQYLPLSAPTRGEELNVGVLCTSEVSLAPQPTSGEGTGGREAGLPGSRRTNDTCKSRSHRSHRLHPRWERAHRLSSQTLRTFALATL